MDFSRATAEDENCVKTDKTGNQATASSPLSKAKEPEFIEPVHGFQAAGHTDLDRAPSERADVGDGTRVGRAEICSLACGWARGFAASVLLAWAGRGLCGGRFVPVFVVVVTVRRSCSRPSSLIGSR